jgi:hypothetical protein
MKSTIKLFLAVILFSSVVFADGEMPTTGKTCTSNCFTATPPTGDEGKTGESEDSILIFVREYLDSIYKYFEN